MSNLEYDPELPPPLPVDLVEMAQSQNMQILQVNCKDGPSLFVMTPFLPMIGNNIVIEGKRCHVTWVGFNLIKYGEFPTLRPCINVTAAE
jgi:hypothetical protein